MDKNEIMFNAEVTAVKKHEPENNKKVLVTIIFFTQILYYFSDY